MNNAGRLTDQLNLDEYGNVGSYFVLYFDVQGVRDQVFRDVDPKSGTVTAEKQLEINEFSTALRDLFASFAQIGYFITERRDEYLNYLTQGMALSENERASLFEDIKNIHIGAQQFSDSTLIYVRDTGSISRVVFEQCMARCAYEIVKVMGRGVYVRGAMSYGTGWELMPNCLFGPIIQEVYDIEQKIANTFRIVVTPAFWREASKDLGELKSNGLDVSKPHPFKMIARDPDGVLIFDYLSCDALENMKSFDGSALKIAGESVEKAYNRIVLRHKELLGSVDKDQTKSRLVVKYAMFMSYLESRFKNFAPYGARFIKDGQMGKGKK